MFFQARLSRSCIWAGVTLAITLLGVSACKFGGESNLASSSTGDSCATQRQRVTDLESELARAGTVQGGTAGTGTMEQQCAAAQGTMNGEYCTCADGKTVDLVKKDVCAGGTVMEGWLATSRNQDKASCEERGGTFNFPDGACTCNGVKVFGSFNIRNQCTGTGGGTASTGSTDYMGQCQAAGLVWADGSKDDGCRCPDNSSVVRHPYDQNKGVCQQAATNNQTCDASHPGWSNDAMSCTCPDGSTIMEMSTCSGSFGLTGDSGALPPPGFSLAGTRDRATIERELVTARDELRRCNETAGTASANVSCAVVEKSTGTVQATCFGDKPESQCRSEFATVYESVSPGKYELKVFAGVGCDEAKRRAGGGTAGGASTDSTTPAKLTAFQTACSSQGGEVRADSAVMGGHRCTCPSTGGMQSIGGWTEGSATVFQNCPRVDFNNPSAAQVTEFRTQCSAANGTVNQAGGFAGGYNCVCPSGTNSLQNWMTAGGMGDPDYMKGWCGTTATGGSTTAVNDEAAFRTACTAGNARIVPNSSPTLCECQGGDRSSTAISVWVGVGRTANYYVSRCGARPTSTGGTGGTTSTTGGTGVRQYQGNYCNARVYNGICGVINCNGPLSTCRFTTRVNAATYQNDCARYCSQVNPGMPRW